MCMLRDVKINHFNSKKERERHSNAFRADHICFSLRPMYHGI
jgi:hypothetical protein